VSLVSVVLPCHDLGRHLEDAVDSIFAQGRSDFEIVVVDDGSTDSETRRLLAAYDWPRTRVIARPAHHAAGALAAGLAAAEGEFIAFLDPRHSLAPTYLERAVGAFEADPALGLVTCRLEDGDEGPPPVRITGLALPDLLVACTVAPGALARRDAILAAGGIDEAFTSGPDAEWDLWIRLAERGLRSAVIPEALVRVGRNGSGGDGRSAEDDLEAARRLIDKHGEAYTRHLLDVVAGKDALRRDVMSRNESLARHLDVVMTAERDRVRRESEARRGRLGLVTAAAPAPWADNLPRTRSGETEAPSGLEAALAAARHELECLRGSASWRITAPLRAVHAWLSGRRSSD
jgi:glycosyltransferase involved in cell wall biosynthesis